MILSVSRRTDIPNYYADWFLNRIKDGYAYVRNPMNHHQVSRINLSPEVVDCIVFWTKNPKPLMERLDELAAYPYYFQFTLTGYGRDMEWNIPHKKKEIIPAFCALSEKIGKERVIWRYDPIIFTQRYSPEYHLHAFEQIAGALQGYTQKCVISFVDQYAKNKKRLEQINAFQPDKDEWMAFAKQLSRIAKKCGISIGTCAETIDLESCNIAHNCCIDRALIEQITGRRLKVGKDKNQRAACGCVESVELGAYNTCKNACIYCYANDSIERVRRTCSQYDPMSPILCGTILPQDSISERKVKSQIVVTESDIHSKN